MLLNMLGQSAAVWFIEELHENPATTELGEEFVEIKVPLSIPYGTKWQNDNPTGLIRYGDKFYNIVEQRYENDSLYTLMQANLSAREQFFALADKIQQEFGHDQNNDGNPFEKSARLFSTAIKHYMTSDRHVTFFLWEVIEKNGSISGLYGFICHLRAFPGFSSAGFCINIPFYLPEYLLQNHARYC